MSENIEHEDVVLTAEELHKEEMKYLEDKIVLLEHKLGNYFDYMDINELAYWLCFSEPDKLCELKGEINLYKGATC